MVDLSESRQYAQPNILKHYFAGNYCNQLICSERHTVEREETFYQLSLDVKGKKNITESLGLSPRAAACLLASLCWVGP